MKNIDLGSWAEVTKDQKEFKDFSLKFPRRYAKIVKSVDVSGDFIENSKTCTNCFSVFGGAEDSKNLWLIYSQVKDSYDIDHSGMNSMECYEGSSIYPGNQVLFSRFIYEAHHIEYSYNCNNGSYLFGCVGIKNKNYCIFNKQYSPEEWRILRDKIVEQMGKVPYIDKKGRVYKYGEFFPVELSPFAYNETVAQEIHPLSKEEVENFGFNFIEKTERNYKNDKEWKDLPDNIKDVDESILNKAISCEHSGNCKDGCTQAFKITDTELAFYKNYKIPLPRLCPNCRYGVRLQQKNPLRLWPRQCMCTQNSHDHKGHCQNNFETSYSPERKEIIYCETCYQQEIY